MFTLLGLLTLAGSAAAQIAGEATGWCTDHSGRNFRCAESGGGGEGSGGGGYPGAAVDGMIMGAAWNLFQSSANAFLAQQKANQRAAAAAAAQARAEAERRRREEEERRRRELQRKKAEYAAEKFARQDALSRNLSMLGGAGAPVGPDVVDLRDAGSDAANQNFLAFRARLLREQIDQQRELRHLRAREGMLELVDDLPPRTTVDADEGKPLITGQDLLEIGAEALAKGLETRLGSLAARAVGGHVLKAGEFGIKWIDEGRSWMDARNQGLDDALKMQRVAGARIRQLETRIEQMPPGSPEHTRMSYELASQRARLRQAEVALKRAAATSPEQAVKDSMLNFSSFTKAGLKSLPIPNPVAKAGKSGLDQLARHRSAREFLVRVGRDVSPGTRRVIRTTVDEFTKGVVGKIESGTVGAVDRPLTSGVEAMDGQLKGFIEKSEFAQ